MKAGEIVLLEDVCNVEYGTRVVRKRDGGEGYPVYGGGGATFEMSTFNRENRLVIARFGMSEECTRFVSGRFFLNDSGLTVSPKTDSILQRFLDFQMLSLNSVIFALGKGTAQKNLDVPLFRKLPLFIPDISEQHRIVAKCESLRSASQHLESIYQKKRAALAELKQSLLHQAFAGEL